MAEFVIDTNVLLVANGAHQDVSPTCVAACVERLNQVKNTSVVVIDDGYRILSEYQNKLSANRGKGVGDVFLKWLMQQCSNPVRVHQVSLTEHAADRFNEFPCLALEDAFDPPDRKFAAVSNAHCSRPSILQAADCKWIDWWRDLDAAGISIEFVCPDDVCRFYAAKFPDRVAPTLP